MKIPNELKSVECSKIISKLVSYVIVINRSFSFPSRSGKEGPVHAVEWSPKNTEFCVVYGFMPAKATLFNLKCEAIFEFGTLHRNSVYYNPHGNNILLLLYAVMKKYLSQ